jgi:hypothetical protein
MKGERSEHTWQPTALVHELYLELVKVNAFGNSGGSAEEQRAAFLRLAGQPRAAGWQFHVRCARELFEALESPDGTIRLSALHAVQNVPEAALSFGPYTKRDLVDVLLSQAERFRGQLEWLSWIGALAAFHDLRVVRPFTSLIATESHTELLFALANYLRAESPDPIRIELGAALMQNECVARTTRCCIGSPGMPSLVCG